MSDVEVLYIIGTGRSGSTLLASILGSTVGMFSAGELRFIWERGFIEDRRCGCGRHFHECPTWSGVIDETFGDAPPDAGRMMREVSHVTRRHLPKLLAGRFDDATLRRSAGYYLDNVEQLYRGVAATTGEMIVDSSKLPTYCNLLDHVPSLRLRVVHLVRDPRRHRPLLVAPSRHGVIDDDDEEMDRFSVWKSSALWDIWNSTARHLFGGRDDYLCIRYEDLVARPHEVVDQVRAFAGLPPDDEPFVGERTVRLHPNHAVAGNPNRRRFGTSTSSRTTSGAPRCATGPPGGGHRRDRAGARPIRLSDVHQGVVTLPLDLHFVLGTGRCGSTLVHEVLCQHDDMAFLSNLEDRSGAARPVARGSGRLYRRLPPWVTGKGRARFAPSEGYRALAR